MSTAIHDMECDEKTDHWEVSKENIHFVEIDSPAISTSTAGTESFLGLQLDRYFRAKGPYQRSFRAELARLISKSPDTTSGVWAILSRVEQSKSQEHIQAAIDLLARVDGIEREALQLAYSEEALDQDTAFALGMAAGKVAPSIGSLLMLSHHIGMREAAVEIMASMESSGAALLQWVVQNEDSHPLRSRAAKLLSELE